MSLLTKLTFTGRNGRRYLFYVYPKETTFKALPALYAFLGKRSDGRYRVLYIGKTVDLSERFESHHKWDEATRQGFQYLAVCTDVTLLGMDEDEANLIAYYRPCCNEKLVP